MAATGSSATSSVSKGCFVIRPAKSSGSRKRKNAEDDSYNGFPEVHGESAKDRAARHELYTDTWSKVEEEVNMLQSNLNKHVFAKIVDLIISSTELNMVKRVFIFNFHSRAQVC